MEPFGQVNLVRSVNSSNRRRSSCSSRRRQCRKQFDEDDYYSSEEEQQSRVLSHQTCRVSPSKFCHFDRLAENNKKAEYDGFLFVKQKLSKPNGAKQFWSL
uniref:Uncharacterized protein n=1 Tax=Ditylenchus dipsaci TaxID=166011 RepID=A0A915DEV0_9BILA